MLKDLTKIIAKSRREPGLAISVLLLVALVAAALGIGVLLAPRLIEAIEIGTADDINKLLLAMAAPYAKSE